MRTANAVRAVALAAVAGLALSACADDNGDADGGGADGLVSITLGQGTGVPGAFVTYGIEQGFFEAEGLKIETVDSAGAAILPGVVSGTFEIGQTDISSLLRSTAAGLPVKAFAPSTSAGETREDDFSAVLVTEDSDIEEAADLAGQTIAVNVLQNLGEITIRAALEDQGVDTSDISFVELAFPSMLTALESGRVDAVWEIEPFLTQALDAGHRTVLWPYADSRPGLGLSVYITSDNYLNDHPEVLQSFQRALDATTEAVNDDPEAFRGTLPALASLDPALADTMRLPMWRVGGVDQGSLEWFDQQMREFDMLSGDVDLDGLVIDVHEAG